MKKQLIVVFMFCMGIMFTACGNSMNNTNLEIDSYEMKESSDVEEINTIAEVQDEQELVTVETDIAQGLSEAEMLEMIEATSGKTVGEYDYIYVDMDKDGLCEMLAMTMLDYKNRIWYCSSDGSICVDVMTSRGFECCSFGEVGAETYTHVICNFYNTMGSDEECFIFAKKGDEVYGVFNVYGNMWADLSGTVGLYNTYYGAFWDGQMGGYYGRGTYEQYFKYDVASDSYVKLEMVEIIEEEFYSYENAYEIIDEVSKINEQYNPNGVEYSFWILPNGVMYIQCALQIENGNIYYCYYSFSYSDKCIELDIPMCDTPGNIEEGLK